MQGGRIWDYIYTKKGDRGCKAGELGRISTKRRERVCKVGVSEAYLSKGWRRGCKAEEFGCISK